MGVWSSNAEGPRVARTWPSALQPSNHCLGGPVSVACTFPKSLRLRKRAEFTRLTGSACTFAVKGFLVVWQTNDLAQPRLGVTVSKKIGCAVVRNRIKRYSREIFRHNRLLLPAVDLNVIARRGSATMDFHSVLRELEKSFRYIGSSPCSRAARSL